MPIPTPIGASLFVSKNAIELLGALAMRKLSLEERIACEKHFLSSLVPFG